jgi:hypothetical protein
MAKPYSASMPDNLDLPGNWTIRFAALDPSTGNAVAGVSVSGASLIVTNVGDGSDAELATGPFMLVPGPDA